MAGYNYTLQLYQESSKNSSADAMSRLLLKGGATEDETEGEILLAIERLDTSPVTTCQVKSPDRNNPSLAVVREWIMSGWPQALEKTKLANQDEFKACWHCRHESTVHDDA